MPEEPDKLPLVAAIQMNSGDVVEDNLQHALEALAEARAQGAVCAVLPENFAWMGAEHDSASVAEEPGNGPVQSFLSQTAKELGLWLVGGSHKLRLENDNRRVSNTTLVFDPEGERVARYDKIHLFDADVDDGNSYRESAAIKPGDSLVVINTGFACIGLSICYDVRFPELYQALRERGADIIVVPAAFTVPTGQAHWKPLLRARAIENQVYIVAPAQGGNHPAGRQTWGHSVCIDPWGEVIGELDDQPGIVYCPFNAENLTRIRTQMPVTNHHRPQVFNRH